MKKIAIIMALSLVLLPLLANSGELDGMVRTKVAYRFDQQDLPIQEQLVDLLYTHYNSLGSLSVHPTVTITPNKGAEIDLKEVYVDLHFDRADLRIGKQTIIWGEAEGAFITDLVSPRDMRSFILADFTEIRKAVPALKANLYLGDYTLEGIWVTHHVPSTLPSKDSLWARKPSISFAAPPTINEAENIGTDLKNGELFLSLGKWGGSLNWTLNAGTAYSDEPVITRFTPGASFTIDQGFERYSFAGGSMSTLIGSAVLRMEAAAAFNKPMNKINPTPPLPSIALERHTQVQSLVGLDWSMLGSQWSAQYIFTYTHDHHDQLYSQMQIVDQFDHMFTLRYQDTFFDERLTAKVFTYVELSPLNALVRPSLSYSLADGLLVEGGLELFIGDRLGTFGAYRDNTMAWAALRWFF